MHTVTSYQTWTARPGEGRHPRQGAVSTPTSPPSPYETVRPGQYADAYFGTDVTVPIARRVTPSGVAWAFTFFALQCGALQLLLGFPGLGGAEAVNDHVIVGWLPLFLLICASAPLAGIALAADKPRSEQYADFPDLGHPVGVPLCCGVAIALSGIAAVALVATQGPHTVGPIAAGAGVIAATACGTAAGLLTVSRPVLRTPVCWAVLAVWVGLLLRRSLIWSMAGSDGSSHAGLSLDLNSEPPYAWMLLAIGVAGTILAGGIAGFVQSRGQAPLLATVAALWLGATALSVFGPGATVFVVAPWRVIAGALAGAIVGVLLLAARNWWQEYR